MMVLVLAAVLYPALLSPLLLMRGRARALAMGLAPWAAIPALIAGAAAPDGVLDSAWLLLGVRLGLEPVGRVFLVLAAVVWTAAGVYARSYMAGDPERRRYFGFHLLTMSGNLGVAIALDLIGFYFFFSLMTFAAYGLVVHGGSRRAKDAGRVYIALAALAEGALLAAGILAAATADGLGLVEIATAVATSPHRDLVMGLFLAAFGVKAGLVPLHGWLPLAHPIAPTPASAVLSGCMIKVGLLGWIRVLPFGEVALPMWGWVLTALGLAGLAIGVVAGVLQTEAKTVLAYSSVSHIGIMAAVLGVAFLDPTAWRVVLPVTLAYIVHHGVVKGALFLGVGLTGAGPEYDRRSGRYVTFGIAFAALALAGAPLTSGALAKGYVKEAAHLSPVGPLPSWDVLLPAAAVGTTLLMVRVLVLHRRIRGAIDPGSDSWLWAPWAALLAVAAALPWAGPAVWSTARELETVTPAAFRAGIWPILVGGALYLAGSRIARGSPGFARRVRVPPGDLLVPVTALIRNAARALRRMPRLTARDPLELLATHWYGVYAQDWQQSRLYRAELRLTDWRAAGTLLIALIVVFALLLIPR